MKIVRHRNFKKNFKVRISRNPKLIKKFEFRLELFLKDRHNPILRDHVLAGTKSGLRAFSITGDIRVVYKEIEGVIVLYDIGSHYQFYGM